MERREKLLNQLGIDPSRTMATQRGSYRDSNSITDIFTSSANAFFKENFLGAERIVVPSHSNEMVSVRYGNGETKRYKSERNAGVALKKEMLTNRLAWEVFGLEDGHTSFAALQIRELVSGIKHEKQDTGQVDMRFKLPGTSYNKVNLTIKKGDISVNLRLIGQSSWEVKEDNSWKEITTRGAKELINTRFEETSDINASAA